MFITQTIAGRTLTLTAGTAYFAFIVRPTARVTIARVPQRGTVLRDIDSFTAPTKQQAENFVHAFNNGPSPYVQRVW